MNQDTSTANPAVLTGAASVLFEEASRAIAHARSSRAIAPFGIFLDAKSDYPEARSVLDRVLSVYRVTVGEFDQWKKRYLETFGDLPR